LGDRSSLLRLTGLPICSCCRIYALLRAFVDRVNPLSILLLSVAHFLDGRLKRLRLKSYVFLGCTPRDEQDNQTDKSDTKTLLIPTSQGLRP